MTRLVRRRLRVPLGMFIAGTVLAGAWAIGGGTLRWWAIAVEAMVLGWSVACYVWAGEDNDEGALAGSRADERQKLVGQRPWPWPGLWPWLLPSPASRSRSRPRSPTHGRSGSFSSSRASLMSLACRSTVPATQMWRRTRMPAGSHRRSAADPLPAHPEGNRHCGRTRRQNRLPLRLRLRTGHCNCTRTAAWPAGIEPRRSG